MADKDVNLMVSGRTMESVRLEVSIELDDDTVRCLESIAEALQS